MLAGADTGFSQAQDYRSSTGAILYVLGLEVIQVGAAVACLGLYRPWGERLPQWLPAIGGRIIHRLVPTTIGSIGAVLLSTIVAAFALLFLLVGTGLLDAQTPADGMSGLQATAMAACYAPMLLWPPALIVGLVGYWRRRAPRQHRRPGRP